MMDEWFPHFLGKLLVEQCREELEDLEKHMFHVGKTPGKQDAEEQGENEVGGGHAESAEETDEPNPLEALTEMFQLLKQVTGILFISINIYVI